MRVRTIEDNFDYQVIEMLKNLKKEFNSDISKCDGEIFSDWLWNNRKYLGTIFYEKVDEYFGMNEIIEEMESKEQNK